jgi:hypothetical protein
MPEQKIVKDIRFLIFPFFSNLSTNKIKVVFPIFSLSFIGL